MEIIEHQVNGKNIATLTNDLPVIRDVESATDLIGNLYYLGYDALVLQQSDLILDFFDLKTKLAGEVLQKFSNYRIRLAIVGDWSQIDSKSLLEFIRESNAGSLIFFANNDKEAMDKLSE
ncbi:DUF4180 domain-containing protein [Sphingobacterium griseoflavum]|uniref:DUF4180 domain-containing protein n=1 Tax=Sphingobacterium griseoflavum TaxID=1474952 RepID=A0ABQ3I1Z8_9SPHI|nr:DUF4180 domain-containing protein [Sphingobacterium griseoflavum]GHE48570.1 hypothetical protein GCM10017764_34480 [Sphingobacterium griseoflavum]